MCTYNKIKLPMNKSSFYSGFIYWQNPKSAIFIFP